MSRMCEKRIIGCTLCACLFALFCLSLESFAVRAIAGEGSVSLSGLLQLRYDGRYPSDGEDNDHKLHQIADIYVKENKWGHLRFSLSGNVIEDIDSNDDDDQTDRTRTIHDTWDSSSHAYLYVCQAEIYELGRLDYTRLGRQYVNYELATTHLDGLNCMFNLYLFDRQIKPFFYAGVPVRLYEDAHYWDAQEYGGGAHILLDRFTKMTLEHQFIKEDPDIVGSYREAGTKEYKQSALSLRHAFLRRGYGYVSLYLLDNSPKYVKTRFALFVDRLDLDVEASYFYQFDEIDETPSASAYTSLTGEIKPYHNVTLDMTKGLYKDFVWISGGTQWRVLDSGEEETEFNHSYNHEYLALIVENIPIPGLYFSVQGDFWHVMDGNNDDTIVSGGGEIGYRKPKEIDISVGSVYSLYEYDYFVDTEEKTDVYTIYSDIRYYMQPKLYFDARYELDIYDLHDHRFIATVGLEI